NAKQPDIDVSKNLNSLTQDQRIDFSGTRLGVSHDDLRANRGQLGLVYFGLFHPCNGRKSDERCAGGARGRRRITTELQRSRHERAASMRLFANLLMWMGFVRSYRGTRFSGISKDTPAANPLCQTKVAGTIFPVLTIRRRNN